MRLYQPHQNPFRVSQLQRLAYLEPQFHLPDLVRRLEQQRFRGLIMGAQGSGKTALLRALGRALAEQDVPTHTLCFRKESRRSFLDILQDVPQGSLVLLDGLEQLGVTQWLRLRWSLQHTKGIVATSHHPGRLRLLHRCEANPELLETLLETLCGVEADAWRALALSFFAQHRGNLHEVFLHLYDVAAGNGPVAEKERGGLAHVGD